MDQLVLQGREPALRHRVIPALTGPREVLDQAVGIEDADEVTSNPPRLPRSVCTIRPGAGRRAWRVMFKASQASSAHMWSAMAQPTTRPAGRKGPTKLTGEVRAFLDRLGSWPPAEAAAALQAELGVCLHPRTILRARLR